MYPGRYSINGDIENYMGNYLDAGLRSTAMGRVRVEVEGGLMPHAETYEKN